MKKVYIRKTRNTGEGVFAKGDIKKDELIFIIKGKKHRESYDPKVYYKGLRWIGIGKCLWIIPYKTNVGHFINYSCKPNAGIKRKIKIVAMRNIKKDKEITIDYSTTEEDPYWKMECKCGNKECRKIILNINSLPKNIFNKYRPYISKYFREVYLNKS